MEKRKKMTLGLGIGCGVVVILCIGMLAGGLATAGFFVSMAMQEPEDVLVHVEAPIQVTKGEEIELHIEVENVAAESQRLDSIDISSDYLDGIVILGAKPAFVDFFGGSANGMKSYMFQHEIPPGAKVDVRFTGVAIEAGDFAGMINVCINKGYICESLATRTVVEE